MSRWMFAASRLFCVVQVMFGVRVIARLLGSSGGSRIQWTTESGRTNDVSVLIPVLNEAARIEACLEGAVAQGNEVREILVVDGGSTDSTQEIVERYSRLDSRVRFVSAPPVPQGMNGKAWQLQVGYDVSSTESRWILMLDADVRPQPRLAQSLLAHQHQAEVAMLSVATRQRVSGLAEGFVHPSMLTTLVYRFGIPGHATNRVDQVQANGQCCLADRAVLQGVGGFSGVTGSVCEDVTLARAVAAAGRQVGFYESDDLVDVEMYSGWRDAWNNWTRSLPLRDRYVSSRAIWALLDVLLVQALPLWVVAIGVIRRQPRTPVFSINLVLLATRIGVLAGTARAYAYRPWSYWISPLADLPVTIRLLVMSCKKRHVWRGRDIIVESAS